RYSGRSDISRSTGGTDACISAIEKGFTTAAGVSESPSLKASTSVGSRTADSGSSAPSSAGVRTVSLSSMILRMEARISSIEGSRCALPVCPIVMSAATDDTIAGRIRFLASRPNRQQAKRAARPRESPHRYRRSFHTSLARGGRLSAPVRGLQADPLVLDGVIMLLRSIDRHIEAKPFGRKAAHGGQDGIAGRDHVALGTDEVDLRGDDVGLRFEHVQRGPLTDIAFLDNARERELSGRHQFAVRVDDLARGHILRPRR